MEASYDIMFGLRTKHTSKYGDGEAPAEPLLDKAVQGNLGTKLASPEAVSLTVLSLPPFLPLSLTPAQAPRCGGGKSRGYSEEEK